VTSTNRSLRAIADAAAVVDTATAVCDHFAQ
jgi:hypothetical protein